MKKWLFLLLVPLCALAWRSGEILEALGVAAYMSPPAAETAPDRVALSENMNVQRSNEQQGMSAQEYARRSQSDPHAYQKFINSYPAQERNEVDKLMNFFARGKYE